MSEFFNEDGEFAGNIEDVKLGKGEEMTEESGPEQLAVTINPDGSLRGDTSHLPEHILTQLQTPEAQKILRDQYRESRGYQAKEKRKVEYIERNLDAERRQIAPNMSRKEFRKLRRQQFHKLTKAALKIKARSRDGR